MANYQKHTASASGNLGQHYKRGLNENGEPIKYANQSIKPELSHLNYNLAPNHGMDHSEFIHKRTSEVKCLKRKDVNVMSSWIVTAPKTLPSSDEKEFFRKTYEFLEEKYGEPNVISAYVHMDESRPHIHFAFVPVVKDKKKGHLKVSAKECVTRQDLQRFHGELSKSLEIHFDREIDILNDATREGNKSIEELKRESATMRLKKVKDKTTNIVTEARKLTSKAQVSIEHAKHRLDSINIDYETKKAYIDQSIIDSDVSKMYPSYAEVHTKGIINKQEVVTVPKDKWEAKHVSANHVSSVMKERDTLESQIKAFQQSVSGEKIKCFKGTIKELEIENKSLKKSLSKSNNQIDRVNKILEKYPEIRELLVKADAELQKPKVKPRNFDRER